ncbi:uncharacterized protein LOC108670065 [Hyalella azteca]|uniref:Uncharacterized protein LOC108670065 n=1 Tax=Hyalella azteca TaxID=294128 RepID=A0A8B7NHA1_HYAAZ|nr:uncharacterized protein LOC108670065 [Hyalella azteca]
MEFAVMEFAGMEFAGMEFAGMEFAGMEFAIMEFAIMEFRRPHPILLTGIPQLQLPPLDPYHLSPFTFNQLQGPLQMSASFDDIVITGLSKFNLHYFDWNYSLRKMFLGATIPTLIAKGKYNIMGRIFGLPLQAAGAYSTIMNGIEVEAESDLDTLAKFSAYLII